MKKTIPSFQLIYILVALQMLNKSRMHVPKCMCTGMLRNIKKALKRMSFIFIVILTTLNGKLMLSITNLTCRTLIYFKNNTKGPQKIRKHRIGHIILSDLNNHLYSQNLIHNLILILILYAIIYIRNNKYLFVIFESSYW